MNNWVDTLVVGIRYVVDEKSIDAAVGGLSRVGSTLANGAAAILATGAALTGMAISQAMAQDETAKLAGTLRTSTEEMTALQYAAERSGVPMSGLHQTLERLSRSLTEAAVDAKSKAGEAFKEMGISARNADGSLKNTAQILPEIAGGLQRISDEGRRSEIMIDLLGRSSARLEGFMAQGEDGINSLTDRAHELGIVLNSEAAANSEALADAMLDLRGVLGLVGRRIGDVIIPHLTEAAKAFTEWFRRSDNFLQLGLDKAIDALSWSLEQLHTPLGQAVGGSIAFVGTAASMVKAANAISSAFQLMGVSVSVGMFPVTASVAAIATGVAVLAAGAAVLYGVIDEVAVTAEGGDTVLRRMYDGLGLGDELARGLAAGLRLAGNVASIAFTLMVEGASMLVDKITALGKSAIEGGEWIAGLAASAASAVPGLEPLARLLERMSKGLAAFTKSNIGSWLTGLEGLADVTGRVASGEVTEQDMGLLGAVGAGNVGAAVEAANFRANNGRGTTREERDIYRQRYIDAGVRRKEEMPLLFDPRGQRSEDSLAGFMGLFSSTSPAVPAQPMMSGPVSVSPSVSVSVSGSSAREIARAVAAETERIVYDQMGEVEGMQ